MRSLRVAIPVVLAASVAPAHADAPRTEPSTARAASEPEWPERWEEGTSPEAQVRAATDAIDFLRFFTFEHKRYLYSKDGPGSLAWVPTGAALAEGAALPTVVFLHGLNEKGRTYRRLDGGPEDLRPALRQLVISKKIGPFLLLAPTHTRYALGAASMWPAFDLGAFLDRAEAALAGRFRVARDRVVLVGHSAGGCNSEGGILSAGGTEPAALLAVDTCLGEKTDNALEALALRRPLTFVHERHWKRDTAAFRSFCELLPTCRYVATEEIPELDLGRDPHAAVLPWALARELPRWIPASSGSVASTER